MKNLNNYLNEGFFGNIGIGKTGMIETWLKSYDIKDYTINSDYTIDVNGSVYLNNIDITELPEYIQFGIVKGDFFISRNPITTLRGCPKEVGGCFSCSVCTYLKSLEGAPKEVGKGFSCVFCKNLKSLEGSPKEVGGGFYCEQCSKLTTLKGSPKEVGGSFYCYDCKKLTSLEGAPKEVGGDFYCGKEFTEDDVKKYCNVKKRIYV